MNISPDCGSPMYVNRTGNGKRVANFSCSGYGKIPVGSKCSSGHRVNADSVMALIQETLREIVRFSKEDEEEFVRVVKAEAENQQSSEIKGQKTVAMAGMPLGNWEGRHRDTLQVRKPAGRWCGECRFQITSN